MRRLPSPSHRRVTAVAALAFALAACAPEPEPVVVREVTPAFLADNGARHASLAADDHGRVALTFVTPGGEGHDVWIALSSDSGSTFGAPVRLNARDGAVQSYAESRPLAAFGAGGRLAVAWSESARDTAKPLAANVVVRASGDGGATFAAAVRVNDDLRLPPLFHGFASLAFLGDGALVATWLDERNNKRWDTTRLSFSLVASTSRDGGQTWSPNVLVSDRACPCCRPAIATAGAGEVAIAYRASIAAGRSRWSWDPPLAGEEPAHDPALARSSDGGATFPLDTLLSADGWRMNGCPSDGPVLTWSRDEGGEVAWLTRARGRTEVFVAPWNRAGSLAGVKRAVADSLEGAAHPRLAARGGDSWLALDATLGGAGRRGAFVVRLFAPDGSLSRWMPFGADAVDGTIAALGHRTALVAWSERESGSSRVRVARVAVR